MGRFHGGMLFKLHILRWYVSQAYVMYDIDDRLQAPRVKPYRLALFRAAFWRIPEA